MVGKVTLGEAHPVKGQPVLLDGVKVGRITKPQFGKGFFLELDGVTWNNAPGARFVADAGGGAPKTYSKNLKDLVARAQEHYDKAETHKKREPAQIGGKYVL